MRTAEDIIRDYRERGYGEERLRALANGRSEPTRSEMLAILDLSPETPEEESAAEIVASVTEDSAGLEIPPPEISDLDDIISEDSAIILIEDDKQDILAEVSESESADVAETIEMKTDEEEIKIIVEPAELEHEKTVTSETAEDPEEVAQLENIQDMEEFSFEEACQEEKPLASVLVERISEDEYYARRKDSEAMAEITRELIDLRDEENIEDFVGEPWPTVESVEDAEHSHPLTEKEESALIAFRGEGEESEAEQGDLFGDYKSEKAATRSLQIIREAFDNDPSLAEETANANNIISLDAPYAVDLFEHAEDEIMMDCEESGLIRFPSEMMPMYEAIGDTMDRGSHEEIAESNHLSLVEMDVPAIDFSEEFSAEDEVDSVSPEEFLAAVTTGYGVDEQSEERALEVEAEIATLRNWLTELEDALQLKDIESGRLSAMIEDRNETLKLQSDEIERLRDEVSMKAQSLSGVSEIESKYLVLQGELAEIHKQSQDVEYELNVLRTETVPNLQSDKADLLEIMESQAMEVKTMRTALSSSGRRVALGYTLAAAASFMVILMPIFHVVQSGNREAEFESTRSELAAELERSNTKLQDFESAKFAMSHEIENLKQTYALDQVIWKKEKERFQKSLSEKETELASLKNSGNRYNTGGPNPDDVRQSNRDAGIADAGNNNRVSINNSTINNNRNEVRGVFVTAKVQRGESLSEVLWRKTGVRGDPTIWEAVAKMNSLSKNASGSYYIIHPGQELKLPKDPSSISTASANW